MTTLVCTGKEDVVRLEEVKCINEEFGRRRKAPERMHELSDNKVQSEVKS
jgi:hypothetical protein